MIVCIDTYGVDISKDNNCFKISGTEDNIIKTISPLKVNAFQIYKPCNISTPAILLAVENNIPIIIHDNCANPVARISTAKSNNHGLIKKHQIFFCYHNEGIKWVKQNLFMKATAQTVNAKYCAKRKNNDEAIIKWTNKLQKFTNTLNTTEILNLQQLRILEAQTSRCYWHIIELATEKFGIFKGREQQTATLPFNAALHYGYGMLYNLIETATLSAGLDPQISIMHTDKYATRSFVFDAIEPFRPWIDLTILDLFFCNQLSDECFELIEGRTISLNKKGKGIIIPAITNYLNEKNVFNNRKIKRKDQIQFYLTQLAQYLLKEFNPFKNV